MYPCLTWRRGSVRGDRGEDEEGLVGGRAPWSGNANARTRAHAHKHARAHLDRQLKKVKRLRAND
jgi:hypothetical protein